MIVLMLTNFLGIPVNQQKSCRYFLLYTYYCENVTQQRYCYRKKVMMRTIQVLVVATVINLIASFLASEQMAIQVFFKLFLCPNPCFSRLHLYLEHIYGNYTTSESKTNCRACPNKYPLVTFANVS